MAILRQDHCPFCGSQEVSLEKCDFLLDANNPIPYAMQCSVCKATGPRDNSERFVVLAWESRMGANVPDAVDCPFCGEHELVTIPLPRLLMETCVTYCASCLACGPFMATPVNAMKRWCHRELKALPAPEITYTARYLAASQWWTEAFDAYTEGGRVGYQVVENRELGHMLAHLKLDGSLTAPRYVAWDTLMVLKPAEQSDYAVYYINP